MPHAPPPRIKISNTRNNPSNTHAILLPTTFRFFRLCLYRDENNAAGSAPGAFRNGAVTGTSYADFANSYDPLNSYNQGSGAGTYTVRSGETLQSIAANIYGDASLWYKIADANGIRGTGNLFEGQRISLPAGVQRNTHNANTFKTYDASETIGDLTPNNSKPPKKNKCGTFGAILLAVVAIAVTTIVTAGVGALATGASFSSSLGAMFGAGGLASLGATTAGVAGATATTAGLGALGAIGAGVAGAVAGSIVSQGLGIATGIQDKFSWKGVALAGIGAGIGGALGGLNAFGAGAPGSVAGIGNAVVRGALGSALTQGVGVVTGLQSKFDFAGVAAAGIGAGVADLVGSQVKGQATADRTASFGNVAASSAASAIANAATRSAINGDSFGRNLIAAVPDVVAGLLQKALGTAFDEVQKPGVTVGEAPTDQSNEAADERTLGAVVTKDLKYEAEVRSYKLATRAGFGSVQFAGGEGFSPSNVTERTTNVSDVKTAEENVIVVTATRTRSSYIVGINQNPYSISQLFGANHQRVLVENNLNERTSRLIQPGAILQLPDIMVANGDTLESIAKKFGTSIYDIMHDNNLSRDDDIIGRSLIINGNGGDAPIWNVYPRRLWNSNSALQGRLDQADRPYNEAVLHHSVSYKTPQSVYDYHVGERGFGDVGYHFLIASDGTIYEGRSLQFEGAHVAGNNPGKIGIAYLGDYTIQPNTSAQIASTRSLLDSLRERIPTLNRLSNHGMYDSSRVPETLMSANYHMERYAVERQMRWGPDGR